MSDKPSLAIAYGVKKRMASGGDVHAEDCPGCEMCHGGEMYAKGGEVDKAKKKEEYDKQDKSDWSDKKYGEGYSKDRDVKGVHTGKYNPKGGKSEAGIDNERSKGKDYGTNRVYSPEQRKADAKRKHYQVLSELKKGRKRNRQNLAEGGEVYDEPSDDIVDVILMSRGGQVANDTDMYADMQPNEFDDLVLRDDLEFIYDGENSGDNLGNEQKEEDERDVVNQVMKSRRKKDRLPNPR